MNNLIFEIITEPTEYQESKISIFIDSQKNANFFHSIDYFKACKKSPKQKPYFFVAINNDKISGLVLIVCQSLVKVPLLKKLSSRNVIPGGFLIENEDTEILDCLLQFYKKNKPFAIYTQVRNSYDISKNRKLFESHSFKYKDHLNIIVDLNKSDEQLWKEVHTKRRNEIRRASKEGTTFAKCENETELKNAFNILKQVYKRAKLPLQTYSHFKALFDCNSLIVFIAKNKEKSIGCMLCLSYKNVLFDYYAGAYLQYYNKYPNDLIPWEVFLWAKKNNYSKFDFGGAGKPNVEYGVRDYKKKFGGEIVNFGRFEFAHFPILFNVLTKIFRLIQRLKK
jgi:serine/alanine adding enzyme